MSQDVSQAMKDGMRRLASGVSVVTAVNEQGVHFAMTASSVTSVSDSPASLLVCIHKNAALYEAIEHDKHFAVNILSAADQAISNACAGGAEGEKRFDLGKWREVEGVRVLEQAETSFVCRLKQAVEYGTHLIAIGDIEQVFVSDAACDPLIYVDGGYQA